MATTHVALTEDRTIVSWLTPERRRWLYAVVAAALALAGAYGLIDDQLTSLWEVLGAAVLGVATAHTGGVYEAPVNGVPVDTATTTDDSEAGTGA